MPIVDEVIEIRTPKPVYNVLSSIKKRFSPRIFSNEVVADDDLKIMFEAARWAPSARYLQPWHFFWTKKGSLAHEKMFTCVPERNYWAKSAPLIITACYDLTEPTDGINKWAQYDLGAAVLSLVLQAQELGYFCRQIGSFDTQKAKEVLKITDPFIPFTLIVMGKMGKDEDYANSEEIFIKKDLTPVPRKEQIDTELL